ncbi:MAG: SUMF1/EgtB/PvdO family nonheme iron enzyme [Burkholderiales bacterium]|nr:SUMF1/EgtB/PvdO family nonheme iron enzyme [Burkholderiales bacterium]
MSSIFINYRRDDSSGYAIHLYDRLADCFGRDHIFMDLDQIAPGDDFHDVINEKLKSVQVAVVLIGKHWLNSSDANGQRRLDHPDDWVRLEIAVLLERNIRVIPVLVGGAVMPKSTELPDCLASLSRRNAYEISDQRYHADVGKLIQVLEKIIGAQPQPPFPPQLQEKNLSKAKILRIAAIFGVTGLFIAAIMVSSGILSTASRQPTEAEPEKSVTAQPVSEEPEEKIIEPEMVRIPAGTFLMGSPETEEDRIGEEEGPQHKVTIASFEMSRYEITVGQFWQFVRDMNYRTAAEKNGEGCWDWNNGNPQKQSGRNWYNPGFDQTDDHPVACVSWADVQAYVLWLSQQTGRQYRLPSEAEWEYAARAGMQTRYWWGDDIGKNKRSVMVVAVNGITNKLHR